MKLRGYLEWDGIEVMNENRALQYIENGLVDPRLSAVAAASGDCYCDPSNNSPYISPAADPAPWYDPDTAASSDFLGLLPLEVRVQNVLSRSVQPNGTWGSTIGTQRKSHRILAVTAILLGNSESSMYFGERWLTTVLGSSPDCADATARILTACDDASSFRTLIRVGLVDGPTFGQLQELPECLIQQVQFQLISAVPHLLYNEDECMSETVLVGGS